MDSPKLARWHPERPDSVTQIYTDWANRCLSRHWQATQPPTRQFVPIKDLSSEIRDYRLLAALIRAIEPERFNAEVVLADVQSNVAGLNACLHFVAELGIRCEKVTVEDIDKGHLSSVFQLIYALSIHKHQQKLNRKQLSAADQGNMPPSSRLDGPTRIVPPSNTRLMTPSKLVPPKPSTPLGPRRIAPATTTTTASSRASLPSSKASLPSGNNNGSTISSGCSSIASSATYASIASTCEPEPPKSRLQAPVSRLQAPSVSLTKSAVSRPAVQNVSTESAQQFVPLQAKSSPVKTGLRAPTVRTTPTTSAQSTPPRAEQQAKMLKLKLFSKDKKSSSPQPPRKQLEPPHSKPRPTGLKTPTKLAAPPKKEVVAARPTPPEAKTEDATQKRTSKSSEEDSAYAGFGSVSPSSASPSSSLSMNSAENEAKEPENIKVEGKDDKEKPTLAVRGVSAPPSRLAKPEPVAPSPSTTSMPKPKSLQSPTVGIVSPMLATRKLSPDEASDAQQPPPVKVKPSCSNEPREPDKDKDKFEKPVEELVPAMAPIRNPPSYEELLAKVRGIPESSSSSSSTPTPPTKSSVAGSSATHPRAHSTPRKPELSQLNSSESVIAIYAKMQARWRECHERAALGVYNDSFEDSSSVSSGISENFDDVSTDEVSGSSLSDHAMAAVTAYGKVGDYSHFVRAAGKGGVRSSSSAVGERRVHEQHSIQALLQQCRTSQRGAACQTQFHTISGVPQLSLSSDGDTLSVQQSRVSQRNATRRQDRPSPSLNGFHSLDRKCHLAELYGGRDELQPRFGHLDQRSTMALVSPRRTPSDFGANRHSVSAALSASSSMSKSLVLLDPSLAAASSSSSSSSSRTKQRAPRTVIGCTTSGPPSAFSSPARSQQRRTSSPHSARLPLSVASPHKGAYSARGRTPEAIYANFREAGGYALARIPDETPAVFVQRRVAYSPRRSSPAHSLRDKTSPGSDFRGSTASVASATAYSSLAEKYEAELRKVNRELEAYRATVNKLTRKQDDFAQLAETVDDKLKKVVAGMEKSALKPDEIAKLRHEIEHLRAFSARLTFESKKEGAGELLRHPSLESVVSQRSSMSSSSKSSKADKASLSSFASKSKKSWIRSSFTKAFTRKKSKTVSDTEGSPMRSLQTIGASNSNLEDISNVATVVELKRQLEVKDHDLTDIRLDVLERDREVDVLRETVNRLKNENKQLRAERERLIFSGRRSRTSSHSSLLATDDDHLYDVPPNERSSSTSCCSKRSSGCQNMVKTVVNVDLTGSIPDAVCPEHEITIGYLPLPEKEFRWEQLDAQIFNLFDAYINRVDPERQLGLHCADSVVGYTAGKIVITTTTTIRIFLRGATQQCVDSIVLESLFPKTMLEQLLKQLMAHRRLVLSGATGIGKSNVARLLCAFLCIRAGRPQDAVIDIRIPEDSQDKQLVQIERDLEMALQAPADSVILLDNIPKSRFAFVTSVFDSVNTPPDQTPFVICTINRACQLSEMQVQAQHNFKVFLLTSKMQGVHGYMARFIRRRVIETEFRSNRAVSPEMAKVTAFFALVLDGINDFIEKSNSMDAAIGPRVFLQCPLELEKSKHWFVQLYNETFVPYMTKVYREGIKVLGRSCTLDDPHDLVCEHWPWTDDSMPESLLMRLPIKEALLQPGRQAFSPLEALLKLQSRPQLMQDNL